MTIGKKRKVPEPHIPFISLADIAWQIIIFFLVAATFALNHSMNVDLPAATNKPQPQQPAAPAKQITVRASEAGLALDGQPVAVEQLEGQLAKLLEGRKSEQDRAVFVEASDDLTFQRDAEVMYAIQRAGGVLVMQEAAPAGKSAGNPAAGGAATGAEGR